MLVGKCSVHVNYSNLSLVVVGQSLEAVKDR